jgi:hypothetical protein
VIDDVSMRLSLDGGDAGGVSRPRAGTGPGEHIGKCLFGIAAGVPRVEVFSVRCGGGVLEPPGMGGARATIVAIAVVVYVELICSSKVRNVKQYGLQMMGKSRTGQDAT